MSSCATQTFTGVTQSQFDGLVQKASTAGITISGNSGETSRLGVSISWSFDPASGALELQCLGKPLFVSCDEINSRIQSWVSASG